MSHGLMFMARYTYSKSLDDASTIGGGGQTVIQNNADPRGDYGLSSFNMTHQFLGNFVYQLPFGDRQRFATKGWQKDVFGAWRVNGTFTAHSGTPFTVRVFSKNPVVPECAGHELRARGSDWRAASLANPTRSEWFNTAAFSVPTGMLRRCGAKFRDRPGRVHDEFGTVQDDSVRARRIAAARFQLEHYRIC